MIGGCQGVTAWFLGLHDQGLTETVGIWLAEFYKFLILFYSDGHWITDFLSSSVTGRVKMWHSTFLIYVKTK